MYMDRCRDNPLYKPQTAALSFNAAQVDSVLPDELRVSAQKVGPVAATSLEIFVDLGMSDEDIGRYFGLPGPRVSQLRKAWRIAACRQR